jgi:hypothetical protein
MAEALHGSELPHAACDWRRLMRGKFHCRSTHNGIGGTLAVFVCGSNLTMSARSHRSNLDTTILLTVEIYYAYTRANTFLSTSFTVLVALMTPTLGTRPWATWLQVPHARVPRSLGVSPKPNVGTATVPQQNLTLPNKTMTGRWETLRRPERAPYAMS